MSDCDHSQTTQTQSRRPLTNKFHQQNLPAWQPVLNAGTVFRFFLFFGILFLIFAVLLLVVSNSVSEVTIPYTDCVMVKSTTKCSEKVEQIEFFSQYKRCKCRVTFELRSQMKGTVFMYYGLTNFHQNHRRYVRSRDHFQLTGRTVSSLSFNCKPYRTEYGKKTGKDIAPCGAVANTLFNDTFKLFYRGKRNNSGEHIEVKLLKNDISWNTDKERKFGTPSNQSWEGTVKPPAWPKPAYKRVAHAYKEDEELQVWMRTAALPNFRKLHRRINHNSNEKFKSGLPKGYYLLEIQYAYPVSSFGGTKSVILSTTSWMGGRNSTLGCAYLLVGLIQTTIGILFCVIHEYAKKRTLEIVVTDGKMTYRTSAGHIEPMA